MTRPQGGLRSAEKTQALVAQDLVGRSREVAGRSSALAATHASRDAAHELVALAARLQPDFGTLLVTSCTAGRSPCAGGGHGPKVEKKLK